MLIENDIWNIFRTYLWIPLGDQRYTAYQRLSLTKKKKKKKKKYRDACERLCSKNLMLACEGMLYTGIYMDLASAKTQFCVSLLKASPTIDDLPDWCIRDDRYPVQSNLCRIDIPVDYASVAENSSTFFLQLYRLVLCVST